MDTSDASSNKHSLRQLVRHQRQHLTPKERSDAAEKVCQLIGEQEWFANAQSIAVYFAFDGELCPSSLVKQAWAQDKDVYLPCLTDDDALIFRQYRQDTSFVPNRYNIEEPDPATSPLIDINKLDLILIPLAAFDTDRNRIGMGSGYYDRTLARLNNDKTTLVGLAYQFQCVVGIEADPWDVKMHKIVTDQRIYT